MKNFDRLFMIVSLSCLLLVSIGVWSVSANYCEEEYFPPAQGEKTYCQPTNFELIEGSPQARFYKCESYGGICCMFWTERYEGEAGCCTDADCSDSDCVPNPGDLAGYLHELIGFVDECIGAPQQYEYTIYPSSNSSCSATLPTILKESHMNKWCAECPDGKVCTKFEAIFNPNLTSLCADDLGIFICAGYDCLAPQCWEICGSDGEFLLRCTKWSDCEECETE